MKKKATVYTRVSTEKIEQEMSLKIQQDHYEQYCKDKGYELVYPVGTYADTGSGTNVRRRPLFVRMLYYAGLDYEENSEGTDIFRLSKRKPEFDIIVVKNAARFSRNSEIGIATVKLLKTKGVNVVFENAGVTSFDDNADLLLSLLFSMAESESHNLSKNISFSKKHIARQGLYRPANLPYGYERNEDYEVVIIEEQAEVVRFIHDSYSEQGSLIIARILNEKGILTQSGVKWAPDRIIEIISGKVYTGTAIVNKTTKVNVTDTQRIPTPEEEWIEIPNAVPPIIALEQFEFNNKIRVSRVNKATNRGRRPSINNIYQDKLFCGHCGARFIRHMGHKGKIMYACQNRRKALGCKVRGISISLVTGFFNRVNISSLFNELGSHGYYKLLMSNMALAEKSLNKRFDELSNQIEELIEGNKQTLEGIKKQFRDGSQAVIDMLTEDIEENEAKIEELKTLRSKINIQSIIDIRKRTEDKKSLMESVQTSNEIDQEEKLKLLKRITVSDYEVSVELYFPNYEEEVRDFNEIFAEHKIESSLGFVPFLEVFRREHLEARQYWNEFDESQREQEEFIVDNPAELN